MHWYRNAFARRSWRSGSTDPPPTKVAEVALMLKAMHASESRTAAEATAERVRTRLEEMNLSKLGQWIAATVGETLTDHAFPSAHWYKIGTNNPLERLLREIRLRTGVVVTFPDGESALNLAAARLRYVAGTEWSTRRYRNMALLKKVTDALA
jgi:putative transposase